MGNISRIKEGKKNSATSVWNNIFRPGKIFEELVLLEFSKREWGKVTLDYKFFVAAEEECTELERSRTV